MGKFPKINIIFSNSSIRTKILIILFLVTLLPYAVFGYIMYKQAAGKIRDDAINNLRILADHKALLMKEYFEDFINDVTILQRDPIVEEALLKLNNVYDEYGAKSPEYFETQEKYTQFFTYFIELYGYHDLYLISPQRNIIYTLQKESDFGTSLVDGPQQKSELSKVVDRAITLLETNISDFKYYDPSSERAAFIAGPVLNRGVFSGIIVLQVDGGQINRIVHDFKGLGKTGEVVIASLSGDKIEIVAPLRNDPNTTQLGSTVLNSELTLPIQRALKGEHGYGILNDYRGNEVIVDWRYFPQLSWGLVVKIDTEEVFEPIQSLGNLLFLIGFFMLLILVVAGISFSKTISKPILELHAGTKIIGDGNLEHKVGTEIRDEIGDLSRAFDKMVENLKNSEQKYRNLVENANVGIYILQDNKFKYVNETFENLTGYSFSEVSQDSFNMIDIVAAESKEFILNRVKTRDLGGELTYHYTFKCIHKSGTIISLESSTSNIEYEGKHAIHGVLRDVTKQLLAEEKLNNNEKRLDAILDTAISAIVVIDKKGIIESFNKEAAKIFGYSEEEVVGENVKILMPEPDKSKHDSYIENYHRTGVAKVIGTGREVVGQRKNGEIFPMKLSLTHLNLDTGVIYTGLIEDLTEYKRAEIEKEELQERLKQSERMESLGLLAGGVAHDLNNIIGPIMAYPDLIRMDYAEGKPIDKDLDTIIHSAQRAADVIADLLALTRRGNYEIETINLNDLINDYLASAEFKLLKSLNPEVESNIQLSDQKLLFDGSKTHLYKVIMNLINNGCESMTDGGVLSISTSYVSVEDGELSDRGIGDGRYQLLTIEDQGEGISEDNLSKIFDPFFTTKLKTGKSGTGLGLSVVYNVIKDHGAHIDVESSLGIGTKFSIYFPETTDKKETTKKENQSVKGSGSILVVDDREEQRDIATRMLTTLGYEVESVKNGKEAINYIKKNQADLVWLDMILEDDMDGLGVYREIIKTNPDQKTIIVSGYSESDRMNEALKLGVNGFIQKPYKIHEIGEKVQEVLNGNHSS